MTATEVLDAVERAGGSLALNGGQIKYTIPKEACLLYTSPSPRDLSTSRMPSSA